jgi:hypothetical protein
MPDADQDRRLFNEALALLVGQPCWGVLAGAGTGSHFDLQLGAMISRVTPRRNSTLAPRVRDHDPDLSLFVTCSWRIDSPDSVVGGCWEGNGPAGSMLGSLHSLVDQTIAAASATGPARDLEVCFSNGHVLRVFCDQTDELEPADNYSIGTAGWISTVGCRGSLSSEYRKPVLVR